MNKYIEYKATMITYTEYKATIITQWRIVPGRFAGLVHIHTITLGSTYWTSACVQTPPEM